MPLGEASLNVLVDCSAKWIYRHSTLDCEEMRSILLKTAARTKKEYLTASRNPSKVEGMRVVLVEFCVCEMIAVHLMHVGGLF